MQSKYGILLYLQQYKGPICPEKNKICEVRYYSFVCIVGIIGVVRKERVHIFRLRAPFMGSGTETGQVKLNPSENNHINLGFPLSMVNFINT